MIMAQPQFQMPYGPIGAMIINPPPPPPIVVAPPPRPVPVGVPFPVAVPMPFGIQIEEEKTTTTTTKSPRRILKIFMPWGPLPFPVPAPQSPHFRAASNNCTNKIIPQPPQPQGFAMPFPMPMPNPPPIIMVPAPPIHFIRSSSAASSSASDDSDYSSSSSSDSNYDSDSVSDSDSDSYLRNRKKKKRYKKRSNRYGVLRSNRRYFSDSSTASHEELKPMLSYLAKNGDVKINKRLSNRDAALLMADEKKPRQVQKVQVIVGNDSNEKSRVRVIAHSPKTSNKKEEKKKIVLRRSSQQLVGGNKELVFRPPGNKKISNFSMSFNIAE
ncbi:unnamed protein product [Arctia plantaginis]|uniref:Uncharacterized protein n=1 Tax=Arctia plantaginis TaxID=874455 RepID=A0A8S0ZM05_ARCPL|nr:unnamed protein product [Arctia plantaginis]